MRLIDADTFTEECRKKLNMKALYSPLCIKELVVDEMPEVEAIPIHFIEEQILLWESLNEKTLPSFYYRELIELWKDKQNDKKTVERTGALD